MKLIVFFILSLVSIYAKASTCTALFEPKYNLAEYHPYLVSPQYYYQSIPAQYPGREPIHILKDKSQIVITNQARNTIESSDGKRVDLYFLLRNSNEESITLDSFRDLGINSERLYSMPGTGYAGEYWTMRKVTAYPWQILAFLQSFTGRYQTIWISTSEPHTVANQYVERLDKKRNSKEYKRAELNPGLQRDIIFGD